MFYVYILCSLANGKSYVGSTGLDVNTRLSQHNLGTNKWTKRNSPFKLIYYEQYICKTDALLREKFYKGGVGKQIKKMILENFDIGSRIN